MGPCFLCHLLAIRPSCFLRSSQYPHPFGWDTLGVTFHFVCSDLHVFCLSWDPTYIESGHLATRPSCFLVDPGENYPLDLWINRFLCALEIRPLCFVRSNLYLFFSITTGDLAIRPPPLEIILRSNLHVRKLSLWLGSCGPTFMPCRSWNLTYIWR